MHGQSVLYRRPGDGGQGREGEDAARPLHQRVTARDEAITEVKVLQHFEYEVIHAVQSLADKAFSAEITRRLNSSLAQVFVALERLEDKGYVFSRESPPVLLRGGRRRRIFKIEASGTQAIRKAAATYSRMSSMANSEISNGQHEHKPSSA